MRAVSRFGKLLLAGALALAPATALAQQSAAPASDTPATDSIGPRDLQNFSLNGTVTRQAEQPAASAPAPRQRQAPAQTQASPPATTTEAPAREATAKLAPTTPAPAPRPTRTASADLAPPPPVQVDRAPEPARQSPLSSSVTVALPNLDTNRTRPMAASVRDFAPAPVTPGDHRFPVFPWLLAALALAGAAGFYFWRNRARHAFVGARVDTFVAPTPVPAPAPPPVRTPSPAPEPAAPASLGIVSTRLRPWIDIGFRPLRCVLENERVVVDFELELFNSGSGPARAVLVEATLFNAGPAQEQEIGGFFANPVAQGERIAVIPPLKRLALKTQVAVPRSQMQAYELAGRQVFVPVIAFNALYGWSGGDGQTSVSYLLGRDTQSEKMGPFRLDLGPHIFRGIVGRLLATGVRK